MAAIRRDKGDIIPIEPAVDAASTGSPTTGQGGSGGGIFDQSQSSSTPRNQLGGGGGTSSAAHGLGLGGGVAGGIGDGGWEGGSGGGTASAESLDLLSQRYGGRSSALCAFVCVFWEGGSDTAYTCMFYRI